jgi:hypothetical protein
VYALAWAAVIVSGVVGIAGVLSGIWLFARQARLTRNERKSQRLADAYLEVLASVERESAWLNSWGVRLHDQTDPEFLRRRLAEMPRPDRSERAKVRALLAAFASDEVKACYAAWLQAANDIEIEHDNVRFNYEQDMSHPDELLDSKYLTELMKMEPTEEDARNALADKIAQELAS